VWKCKKFVKSSVRKPEGMKTLERPRRRWKDNLREMGLEAVDWIHLAQNREQWRTVLNTVLKLGVS
jgi:hypothetical protein